MAGPDHGYDLHHKFTTELGSVWHLSQSQAYAILKRLEVRGDIDAEHVEQEKLPARQRLHLTEHGRRRFMDWLLHSCGGNARSIRLEYLTRLYFSTRYAPDETYRIHASQVEKNESIISRLEILLDNLPHDQVHNRLSLDLRLRQMRLIQQWMAEIKDQFHIPVEERP